MNQQTETFEFKAETNQLLHLMIHSLYTNKDIFLRELISNASDALDKLRFESLPNTELVSGSEIFEIRLEADSDKRTLTIHDNGIGMSREELIKFLGTIAHSGTRELFEKMKDSKDEKESMELIGQFGVGFYSSLMVADKVELVTRRAGEETAYRWETEGHGSYVLSEVEKPARGTSITLHLKQVDADNGIQDYCEEYVLRNITKRYSDFIHYPIVLKVEREEPELDEEGKIKPDGKKTISIEDETLNSMKPIWTRNPSEVKEEEFHEFYKHVSSDWENPLDRISLRAEGRLEYQSLLFIPSRPPFDLYHATAKTGLQLYVRRVRIMEKCEDLLPNYLRFIKGVVDSSDLPLNVSRELLQHDRVLTTMKKWLTKKILDHFSYSMREERENYLTFWKSFGRVLKEGLSEDFENRDKVKNLLLFESSNDPEALTSLSEYVARMKEGQEEIYFLTGESRNVVENSPHLEAFKTKGIEVLYLTDPIDEIIVDSLRDFEHKKLMSAGKGDVEFGSDEEKEAAEKARKEKEKEVSDLLSKVQNHLDEHVKEVRLSNRLTTSPVCLVGNETDYSPNLERLLRNSNESVPKQKRILEINPDHALLKKMKERFDKNKEDSILATCSNLLLGYALVAEGSELHDPIKFNQQVAEVMNLVL